jgi:hypothetical protein
VPASACLTLNGRCYLVAVARASTRTSTPLRYCNCLSCQCGPASPCQSARQSAARLCLCLYSAALSPGIILLPFYLTVVHTIHTHTHIQPTKPTTPRLHPRTRLNALSFRPQPCRLSPTKSRLRIPPPTPCIGPALASTRRNRPSKPRRSRLDSRLPRPSTLLHFYLGDPAGLKPTTTPPPPPNRRSGHKLNSAFPPITPSPATT